MSKLETSFVEAQTVEHAILESYDIVTPVAEMPGGENFLVFVSYEDASGEVRREFQNMPAEVVESYSGVNHIGLSDLSSEGMGNYLVATVAAALQELPEEVAVEAVLMGRDEVIVPTAEEREGTGWKMPENGMDIREVGQILAGNMPLDTAYEILVRGDLPDALAGALNSAGLDVDTSKIDKLYDHAHIARALPDYTAELRTMLNDPAVIVQHGIPADKVNAALDAISGEAPQTPGVDATLDVAIPDQ